MYGAFVHHATETTGAAEPVLRCRWHITGRVQGVGFRPTVYRVARRLRVGGGVWNDGAGVTTEAQGTRRQLDAFLSALRAEAPAAAIVRGVTEIEITPDEAAPKADESNFEIRRSLTGVSPTAEIAADLAVCPDCLADVRDATGFRRHRYALTNCTHCGPRFSVVRAVPYDRINTTMAGFAMCPDCLREYENPADRRFHAQPTACHACGPKLRLWDRARNASEHDPIKAAAARLIAGEIVAIKGIGGFHLAVRSDNQAAVARLREVKHRPAKPFALMCSSLHSAHRHVHLSFSGEILLTSAAAPIVLAERLAESSAAASVAPGQHRLGIMLAYTPLHHLLFDELGAAGIDTLVMTSGNDADEPLAIDDADARNRLGGLCDAMLIHERPIQRAVDD
jgi:hydrogenase maturation protein HypF